MILRSGGFVPQGASVKERLQKKEEQDNGLDFWRPALKLLTSARKGRRKRLAQISGDTPPVAALVVLELLLTTTLNRSAPTQEHPPSPSLVVPLLHFVCDID